MHNYNHKKLIEIIVKLNEPPSDPTKFAEWIKAEAHLAFLRENAYSDELVIFSLATTFVDSIVVPNSILANVTPSDLANWHFDSHHGIASYVYGGDKDRIWIERGVTRGFDGQQQGTQPVFRRMFDGLTGPDSSYIEVNQEYTHLAGIHWRPEIRAYCRLDKRGDLEPVVSVTVPEDKRSDTILVSFKWEQLEEYLSVCDAALVRRFDFTLLRYEGLSGWSDEPPQETQESGDFYYRRKIQDNGAYTSGIQIVRPRRDETEVAAGIKDSWSGTKTKKHVEFTAFDRRHNRLATISTDPDASTNYFTAKDNSLPFELSPAFFRPEVLSKYKTDHDKYTVAEREVSCRGAWHLRGIDVNEAGQVHAYICDLRNLPHEEQLHWLAHNETPKSTISKRAYVNDFEGQFVHFVEPLPQVLSIVRRWHDSKVPWWVLRDERLLERVNTPLTASRDEWAEAFMDLAKLVVEGFETSAIRAKLDKVKISYTKEDRTITLLEKLLNKGVAPSDAKRLAALRSVQNLRSKAKGHAGGGEADELSKNALMQHDTYTNHFKHLCTLVAEELETIQQLFSAEP